ncbi:MAG: glycosyltransferase, partial [Bacteroidaceae bacterium]|nr:glycosyltransferase [Bacteroidaceae bacterium]
MKISVITAVYNRESTIETALRSVLSQTYKDIEYIIVDGLSTDGTMDIVRRYETLFEGRMRIVSERDKGMYDAMNKGIAMATGDVVGILNSDDFLTADDVIERVAENIEGVDAVYGDVHFIDGDDPDVCVRYYSSRMFRPWMLRFGFMPAHPSFYARREVYEKFGGYALDYKIAADFDLMVRFFCNNRISSRYVDKDFVTMRIGGVSTRNLKNRWVLSQEDLLACRRNGV